MQLDIIDVRISKQTALSLTVKLVPLFLESLSELHKNNSRLQFQPRISALRTRLGGYVKLYENENHLNAVLFAGIIGEENFLALNESARQWSQSEQQEFLEELACDVGLEQSIDSLNWPQSEAEWQKVEAQVAQLTHEERQSLWRQGMLFWSGFFGGFFNILSLMIHGAKLTCLVSQAIAGDDDAFLKAAQIDRLLLTHHPFFAERKRFAQDRGEIEFLSKLAYREINSPLRGKIRYPALYMLFGILESLRWLDDLKHTEILTLCDSAELHRYQNRVDDVGYLTKRLREYRRWQKTGTVSMH